MNENVFENVKFGDAFKTRCGDVAYFQKKSLNEICNADRDGNPKTYLYMTAILFTESFSIECIIYRIDDGGCLDYSANGQCCNLSTEFDIVSRWKEPKISNEELDRLAEDESDFMKSDEEKALEISRGQASETDYVTTAAYNGAIEMSQWKNEQYIETAEDDARYYREGVAKANPDLSESVLNLLETAYIAGRNMLLLK